MDLLVSLDENYLPQLQVLLASLCQNCPGETGSVYLLHRSIPQQKLDGLGESLKMHGWELCPIPVGESLFSKAPVTKQYPQEMMPRDATVFLRRTGGGAFFIDRAPPLR